MPQVPKVIGRKTSETNRPIVKTDAAYIGRNNMEEVKKTIKTVEHKALRGNLRPREMRAMKRLEGVPEFTARMSAWSSNVDLMRLCRNMRYSVEVTREAKRAIVNDKTIASAAENMAVF